MIDAETIEKARQLRALQPPVSWYQVGKQLNCTKFELQCALVPNFMEWRREKMRERRAANGSGQREIRKRLRRLRPQESDAVNHRVSDVESVPQQVLADRALRQELAPRSCVAGLMGDPLPGYSALERRHD